MSVKENRNETVMSQSRTARTIDGSGNGGARQHCSCASEREPGQGLVIGVDIGGTKTAIGLASMAGSLQYEARYPTRRMEDAFECLLKNIHDCLTQGRAPRESVMGIGVGVAGVVNLRTGVVSQAPNVGWHRFPLREALERHFGVPVVVENDVNAATVGEHWLGASRSARHSLFIAAGTGIGAGIMIDGKLYRGHSYSAGEIGYAAIAPGGLVAIHGGMGFLESMASGPALVNRVNKKKNRGAYFNDAREVIRAAEEGDADAAEVVNEAADFLALAVCNAIALLDPEIVVLGGGLLLGCTLIVERIRTTAARVLPMEVPIVLSVLQDKAQLYGAIRLCLDQLE